MRKTVLNNLLSIHSKGLFTDLENLEAVILPDQMVEANAGKSHEVKCT
jgi:hypothetical protein